jgi:hypothetical protein
LAEGLNNKDAKAQRTTSRSLFKIRKAGIQENFVHSFLLSQLNLGAFRDLVVKSGLAGGRASV